ncbi:uncharacterized protein BP5553_07751 [Venustampulla echinocandica]|uniref:RING-type domain-containing protein n=1 Tax=Venustampulla echinocandica TaxID=2656787 RepID=A0A370THF2_9HELO|nr:uncharacterized protein BP5553_07751 [Venustampulla echinocandica]RDL34623.1 hypothetical protein BP5553_07751 [Venustampulla echinocandica]
MPPSIKPTAQNSPGKKRAIVGGALLHSRETTPLPMKSEPSQTKVTQSNTELATIFKTDLTNIRNLCLCNWFVPNRRKKTCPECRTRVKQMPAPAFLIKQLVEVFTKRSELMPSDESVDTHTQRRAEEIADVDKDRNGRDGLFKGTFPKTLAELWKDDADGGVMRCRNCGFEHEGGPSCQNCGAELDDEGYSFSDLDEDADLDDLDALSLELDDEVDAEFAEMHGHNFLGMPDFVHPYIHFHHLHHLHDDPTDHSELSNSDASEMNSESDDEDGGSLADFVAPDDEEPIRRPGRQSNIRNHREAIAISDDDSDEGGAVSNRIPRRRARVSGSSSPSPPSVVTVTDVMDNDPNESDIGDSNSEADMLRHAGWSPLDQENDSDVDDPTRFHDRYGYGYGDTEDDQASDDDSDTQTMVGNGGSDDEDGGRSREEFSETPTYDDSAYPPYIPHEHAPNNYSSFDEEATNYGSEAGYSTTYDRDGDTEMSVSPRSSVSANVAGEGAYGNPLSISEESGSERSMSRSTNGTRPEAYQHETGQNLGVANQIHEIEDDSDDNPIRPPPRRLPRRYHPNARVQQYDPRISLIFAEHQQSMRGTQSQQQMGLDELDTEVRRVEPASRARRLTAYRVLPPRLVDPLRSSRSPSATRVIASSGRTSRPNRYYVPSRR